MELDWSSGTNMLLGSLGKLTRACIYRVLSVGPIPNHFAFIMDGNRRFAKKHKLDVWEGHKAGTLSLLSVLRYLYELGVKYITVYAFSIDNFKRKPEQVQVLMELLMQKTGELLKQESVVNVYGVRVVFIGNLNLLDKPVKEAAEKVMAATAKNTKAMLLVCVAYTSTEEIVHAVHETCKEKCDDIRASDSSKRRKGLIEGVIEGSEKIGTDVIEGVDKVLKGNDTGNNNAHIGVATENDMNREDKENQSIKLADLEKHFYMAVAPEPDILIRSSGATRLSNFLLWQTAYCPLYKPTALWPAIGFYHVVRAIIIYQWNYSYLQKLKE